MRTSVVEITISGGAVQHVDCPSGIKVVIRDYDIEGTDFEGFDIRQDSEGDLYQHMEFEHEQEGETSEETASSPSRQRPVTEDTGPDEKLRQRRRIVPRLLSFDTSDVDWELLRQQKLRLVVASHLVSKIRPYVRIDNIDRSAFDGLISFLDFIQDCAAEIIGEEAVLGELGEAEPAQQVQQKKHRTIEFTTRQTAHILAALRYVQYPQHDISTMEHFEDETPLTNEEIDDLCEEISCGPSDNG